MARAGRLPMAARLPISLPIDLEEAARKRFWPPQPGEMGRISGQKRQLKPTWAVNRLVLDSAVW